MADVLRLMAQNRRSPTNTVHHKISHPMALGLPLPAMVPTNNQLSPVGQSRGQISPSFAHLRGQTSPSEGRFRGQISPAETRFGGQISPIDAHFCGHHRSPSEVRFRGQTSPMEGRLSGQTSPANERFLGQMSPKVARVSRHASMNKSGPGDYSTGGSGEFVQG